VAGGKMNRKEMLINKEDIMLIPAVSRVLIEYERIYDKKTAGEMFNILVNEIKEVNNEKR
jgi:hypothetical protein